jgi:hypothetical protein
MAGVPGWVNATRSSRRAPERLDRLRDLWERHQQFKAVVAELQDALGAVTPESELGRWLDWAHEQVKQSDPLRWCRHRTRRVLTLYYYGYDTRSVDTNGFSESDPSSYGEDKTKAGIKLTDRPPQASHYERPLRIELPEDLVLPYEWIQESTWYWRTLSLKGRLVARSSATWASGPAILGHLGRGAADPRPAELKVALLNSQPRTDVFMGRRTAAGFSVVTQCACADFFGRPPSLPLAREDRRFARLVRAPTSAAVVMISTDRRLAVADTRATFVTVVGTASGCSSR